LQGAESYWKGLIEGGGAEPHSPALQQV
ncbi:MAG: GntR family transcriptional regulator, partial [Mesorhizobium sp.]